MTEHRQPPPARAPSWRSSDDPVMGIGGGVFDNTREFAAQALERAAQRAAQKMRDLRDGVSDTADAAGRQVHRYASATSRYIADQPLRTAMMAVGVGALVTAAIVIARRRAGRH